MARRPKPWYRKARRAWFVRLDGVQHNLGPEMEGAYKRFFELMRQPKGQKVASAEHKEVVISSAEHERFLTFIRNTHLMDLVQVTWETGCRLQESLRVEARHVDLANRRCVIPKSESKTKKRVRVVYLTDTAFEITRRLAFQLPEGKLFRNSNGKAWTTDAVNCAFQAIRQRMGQQEMQRLDITISDTEIADLIPSLSPTRKSRGEVIDKTAAELRCEAKRKLTHRLANELAPRYSLYAQRHSWATHALQRGVDPLTVVILMGHQDPSMLSKVYQHLSLNPTHMLEQARKAAG